MATHTLVKLDDVKDLAPDHGLEETGEARFAASALELEKTGVSLQRLNPGKRQQFGHTHSEQEEIYVVLEGSGRVKVEDEEVELAARDALRVGPGVTRCFEAGDEGLEFVAFGAPRKEGSSDAEMLPGWWSD
jgi:mannose-6-phosphate isomerase-like protein (cupin superfamily)